MEKKFIKLNNSDDVLRLHIQTKEGKETGEYLEFDMEDIDLLDNLQKMKDEIIKNRNWLRNQFTIIEKKQDFTQKNKLMSNNEKMKYDALKSFYKKQKDIYSLFLGENGVDKLLYGRKFEWETMEEIDQIIDKQILPLLNISFDNITKKVKEKYKISNQEEIEEIK